MKICSPFRDYYDSVQGLGQDRSLVYVRRPLELSQKFHIKLPKWLNWDAGWLHHKGFDIDADCFVIGFCGKLYPAVRLFNRNETDVVDKNPTYRSMGHLLGTFYQFDHVDRFIQKKFREESVEEYLTDKWRSHYRTHRWPARGRRRDFREFFQAYEGIGDKHRGVFEIEGKPIFARYELNEGRWSNSQKMVWNCRLADFEFVKMMDPFSAFQEISMFLGGLATPGRLIPEVCDTDLAQAKGFDKWSFRKPPKKK